MPLCCLLMLSITTSNVIGQNTDGSSSLPVAARESINKGIVAAKIPDYLLAARHFEDARKIAPESSEVFFNLGLAESKIPGRELRAISWFDAYLYGNPNAPNGAAIKGLIVELNKKNKINILLMLDMLEDVLKQSSTWKNIEQVAELRIKVGDLNGAKRIINGYDVKSGSGGMGIKNAVLLHIIQSQIAAGDTLGARISLAEATNADFYFPADKVYALSDLALLQMKMKDSAASRNTFAKAINFIASNWKDLTSYEGTYRNSQIQMLSVVAKAQFKAGDMQGAENTLTIALKSAVLFEKAGDKRLAQMKIEAIYLEQGYFEKAKHIIESIEQWEYDWEKQSYMSPIQIAISKKRKEEGNMKAALEAAELIQSLHDKSQIQREIAEFQFNSGDIAGARSTLTIASATVEFIDDQYKSIPLALIALLQAKMGDIDGAKAILKRADKLTKKIPKRDPWIGGGGDVWTDKKNAQGTVANVYQKLNDLANPNQPGNKIDPPPIVKLDPKNLFYDLSRAPFLDLAGHIKSIKENDPGRFFTMVYEPVEQIIVAEVNIEQMLKEQGIIKL